MTTVAVNSFEIEPTLNSVRDGSTTAAGLPPAPVSANPKPRSVTTRPPWTTETVAPAMPSRSSADGTIPSNQASTSTFVSSPGLLGAGKGLTLD